jgi:TRAF3-interacting protein 1
MSEKSENINPAIIKRTQDTLGRVIQAPSLTEKLLNRPPVQFIQDIVKSVITRICLNFKNLTK